MAMVPTEADIEALRLNPFQKFGRNFVNFFRRLPGRFVHLFVSIGLFFKKAFFGIGRFFRDLVLTFVHGKWWTKLSYLIMGTGNFAHKQIMRGCIFLLFEVAFVFYMVFAGGYWFGMLFSLGTRPTEEVESEEGWATIVEGDNSFKILLYGVLTLFSTAALLYTWYLNIKQCRVNEKIDEENKKLRYAKDDLRALVDREFYKTLLSLPTIGIIVFTIMPIVFMILVAFTNYDVNHAPPYKLFNWVGFDNFGQLFNWTSGSTSFAATFGEILVWTLIWAFFATFTNYFLGMLVALLINKKGIKFKKGWRTILVLTVTIPQFISLLYISKMFGENGIVNEALKSWGWIDRPLPFWTDPMWAKITVIVINIWIGIPYLMLMVTGILMNIPADLYESAKIDGANPMQQYMKITLPYMLFVTGPYLLTSFTGNMNNFNVIYLLTGGGPKTGRLYQSAGQSNLLITWLYSMTVDDSNYALASVIGIMVFLVVALISVVVYNIIPSTRNEEDFS